MGGLALYLALALPAGACSILPSTPSALLADNAIVVLARPLTLVRDPDARHASEGWRADHRQQVLWEVTRVWKGPVPAGHRFYTENRISSQLPCSGWYEVEADERRIFRGAEVTGLWPYLGGVSEAVAPELDALTGQAIHP